MQAAPRICVVGSANVDLTFRTPRLPGAVWTRLAPRRTSPTSSRRRVPSPTSTARSCAPRATSGASWPRPGRSGPTPAPGCVEVNGLPVYRYFCCAS